MKLAMEEASNAEAKDNIISRNHSFIAVAAYLLHSDLPDLHAVCKEDGPQAVETPIRRLQLH
jgi:hypothetical protein